MGIISQGWGIDLTLAKIRAVTESRNSDSFEFRDLASERVLYHIL